MIIQEDCVRLEFGQGDIGIHLGAAEDAAMLVFRDLEAPAPVGFMPRGAVREQLELQPTDVLMSFTDIRSIDVLILCLEQIRKELPGGEAVPCSACQAARLAGLGIVP